MAVINPIIAGSGGEFKYATGTYSYSSRVITISGLSFIPREVYILPYGSWNTASSGRTIGWLKLSFSDQGVYTGLVGSKIAATYSESTSYSEYITVSALESNFVSSASATSAQVKITLYYSTATSYHFQNADYYRYYAVGTA